MKKYMKTSVVLAALCVICISAAVYTGELAGAAAYLSHQTSTVNQVVVGYNDSRIEETFAPPDIVKPGTSYPKVVKVKNMTDGECFVRILAEVSDSTIPVTMDLDNKYWTTKQSDGYFYYKTALGAQEETKPLFTKVTAGNTDKAFKVIIYEETVQARGYAEPQDAFRSVRAG